MIDLTPLDVRNKRGDFKRIMRGYDPQEVDVFLEIAADRLEGLVRETMHLRERTQMLQERVNTQGEREQAVQDALVTAQELRSDIRSQAQREADVILKEAEAKARALLADAETEARRMIAEAEAEARSRLRGVERQLEHAGDTIQDLERRRNRFLKEFRGLLERELDVVEVESEKPPFEERTIDLDLGRPRTRLVPPGGAAGRVGAVSKESTESKAKQPEAARATAEAGRDEEAEHAPDTAVADDADPVVEAAPSLPEASGSEPSDREGRVEETDEPVPEGAERRPSPEAGFKRKRGAPPAAVDEAPSSLELELMAGTRPGDDDQPDGRFAGVPDLETVLAEAGMEEVTPPPVDEIEPPPARRDETIILFDPDHQDRKNR